MIKPSGFNQYEESKTHNLIRDCCWIGNSMLPAAGYYGCKASRELELFCHADFLTRTHIVIEGQLHCFSYVGLKAVLACHSSLSSDLRHK